MAIDKLTPRYLNNDSDQKVIQGTEFFDANNIRVTSDKGGNGGVIKNIKGNTSIPLGTSLPAGQNKVIGTYAFPALNKIYVFLYNNIGNHCVYEYDTKSAEVGLILSEPALDFRNDDYLNIDGVVYNEEAYLYFTDGRSNPKKINITKAKAGGYPAGTSITEKQYELNVVKASPKAPTAVFFSEKERKTNSIRGKSFQFAAQYVYRDKEVSALGHYSDLYVSPNTINATSESGKNQYNTVTVSVEPLTGAVEKVRLYFRNNSSMPFYLIEELDYTGSTLDFIFRNDRNDGILETFESNKLQDSVPLSAKAQTISNGRLIYGNYTEGFDVGPVSATIDIVYDKIPYSISIPAALKTTLANNRMTLRFDLSNIPDILFNGGTAIVNVTFGKVNITEGVSRVHSIFRTINGGSVLVLSESTNTKFELNGFTQLEALTIAPSISRSDFASTLATELISQLGVFSHQAATTGSNYTLIGGANAVPQYRIYYGGEVKLKATGSLYSASAAAAPFLAKPVLDVYIKIEEYNLEASEIIEDPNGFNQSVPYASTIAYNNSATDTTFTGSTSISDNNSGLQADETVIYESQGKSTFKAGESHPIGVVYSDKFGRSSGVSKIGSPYVKKRAERTSVNMGPAHIKVQLTSAMPAWADSFFFVYAGGGTYNKYIQYPITEAFYVAGEGSKIHLSLRGLQGSENSYVEENGGEIGYTYSSGDRLRIISYKDTAGNKIYPPDFDFEITDFKNYPDVGSSPFTPEGVVATVSDKDARKIGDFIEINSDIFNGFTAINVSSQTKNDLWSNECVVEIYNKNDLTSASVYYAKTPAFARQYHSSELIISEGNAWFKPRTFKGFEWSAGNHTNGYVNAETEEMETFIGWVEAENYYDLSSESTAYGQGKPYGKLDREVKNNRYSSVTYSDAMVQDNVVNTLSSFNNSFANWYDFDISRGGIYGLVDKSNHLVLLQEDAVGLVPVLRDILSAGQDLIAINSDFINQPTYIPSTAGVQDRGGFIDARENVYFFDVQRGSVYQIGSGGLKNLSQNGLRTHLSTKARELTDFSDRVIGNSGEYAGSNTRHVRLGYDEFHQELIIGYHTQATEENGIDGIYPFTTNYNFKSAVYNTESSVWSTFMDVNADGYASLNNSFYHVKNIGTGNLIYKADSNNTYGEFFGAQYDSDFTVISNQSRSGVKTFNAISIEGEVVADVYLQTSSQSSALPKELFVRKEDEYFSSLPRAEGNNEWQVIGIVSNIVGNIIGFSNPINRLSLTIGGDVYKVVGSTTLVPISGVLNSIYSSRSVVISNVASLSIGDVVAVKASSIIDGDPLRGHWLSAKLTFANNSSPFEIFAVNINTSDSDSHFQSGFSDEKQQ